MNNELWPYVAAGSLALLGVIFGLRKGGYTISNIQGESLENDAEQLASALKLIQDQYGVEYARDIERLIRWETAHFTSQQWKQGNTAGMEATAPTWPYGWNSLETFATMFSIDPALFSTYSMIENNTNVTKTFIRFPNIYSFVLFLAWFIANRRQGRIGYWYSLNKTNADNYENKIAGVVPRIVNSL